MRIIVNCGLVLDAVRFNQYGRLGYIAVESWVLKAASLCDSEGLPLQLELYVFTRKTCSVLLVKLQRNLRLSFCLIEIMNLDSLSFALSQISYSVASLTKKNYKSNVTEISAVSCWSFICALFSSYL